MFFHEPRNLPATGARRPLAAGSLHVCSSAAGIPGDGSAQSTRLQAGRLAGWLAGRQAGRQAGWQAGRQAGWQAGWLAGWLAGRLAGRLAGWQAGRLHRDGALWPAPLTQKLGGR